MNTLRKSLIVACAVSVLGFSAAMAQATDPAPPGAAAAPMGGDAMTSGDKMAMPKKKMSMKKHSKKKMKKTM